jgi:hypothetical protein
MIIKRIDITGDYFPYGIRVKSSNTLQLEQFLLNTYGKEYIGYINTTGIWFSIGRYFWFKHEVDRDSVISKFRKKKL